MVKVSCLRGLDMPRLVRPAVTPNPARVDRRLRICRIVKLGYHSHPNRRRGASWSPMQFRRSGQRDGRRRRVLSDTLSGTVAAAGAFSPPRRHPWAGATAAVRKSEHYGDAAFMDEQPRLSDLVPLRLRA